MQALCQITQAPVQPKFGKEPAFPSHKDTYVFQFKEMMTKAQPTTSGIKNCRGRGYSSGTARIKSSFNLIGKHFENCKFQGKESKAELIFENGKFVEVRINEVSGKEPLDSQNMQKFKKLVETYRDDIVRKWVDFFVYNKPIESERITKKL